MSDVRLLMIRHGLTDNNVNHILDGAYPGPSLNAVGFDQADRLAERLGSDPIEAVFASDITRAVQTATPLAERLGLPVTALAGLREIPGGDQEGATDWTAYMSMLRTWITDPLAKLDGGEDAPTFLGRYDAAIDEIVSTRRRLVAVVSHAAAMGVWISARAVNVRPGGAGLPPLGNTDVVVLDRVDDTWRAASWAGTPLD
ncbi:histidine phosphatase family protein [Brooklawnia cerclae]|uniref:Phosphoglycerate mutase n=1 Tax=Brooklawnia cerclae TaxID=349934 RepID=A0ABX0SIG0_9ACTN|nr:histidine phosphatase family protein [Brooklawnia cerclae]NIH58187.1 putative phosphoglycerate mutase [Brooklawnia cerclae]